MTSDSQNALDNTRRMASQAMERASGTVRDLRASVNDVAGRGLHAMGDRAVAAKHYVGEYAVAGRRYVGEHPVKSALIAAAVGAAVAGLVIAWRNHRSGRDIY